jgi:hypothetical protein
MWELFRRKAKIKGDHERIVQLELDLDRVGEKLDRFVIQHQKLQGAYYRRFGAEPATTPPADSPSPTGKAALRLQLGLMPGRPTNIKG